MKMVTKRSNFVERCTSLNDEQKTVWSKLDLDNDDDHTTLAGMSRSELELQVTTIYKQVVDRAAAAEDAKGKVQQDKLKNKKLLIEKLVEKTPEEYVEMTIDKRVDERLRSLGVKGVGKGKEGVLGRRIRSRPWQPKQTWTWTPQRS